MEGDKANTLPTNLHRTGQVQLVDIPGAHEPGMGDIYYPFLFRHIDASGDIVAWLDWVKEMNWPQHLRTVAVKISFKLLSLNISPG